MFFRAYQARYVFALSQDASEPAVLIISAAYIPRGSEYVSERGAQIDKGTVRELITFSAIANTVASGATEKVNGMTLASTTRRFAVRCTLKSGATTPGRKR